MTFSKEGQFQSFHVLSIDLSCNPGGLTLSTSYKPACHIKLDPPPPPKVNSSTVSWVPRAAAHGRLSSYSSQLQWKQEAQSWTDASVRKNDFSADHESIFPAERQLDLDQLTRGQQYEARTRAKTTDRDLKSSWSDWSPVASWVSSVGRTRQRAPDLNVAVLVMVATAAAFAVFLVGVGFKTNKSSWVYMVKSITGTPVPNPAKSFLQDVDFQSWLSPHFTGESFHSLLKPVEMVSVEVSSAVDGVARRHPEAVLLEKMRSESSHESTGSNFSNPSYSELCPPPVSSLTAGNLAPCVADTPYGPVGGQEETVEQEVRGEEEESEVRLLLSKGGDSMPVVSDYERAEKVQVERVRLQSLDSGVCSGEEVSQDSLEADSMNAMQGEEESEEGDGPEVDVQKLLGGVLGNGSIRVCSGYERVQTPPGGPELRNTDSGLSGVGEEEAVDESSSSTCLLRPPPCSSSPCFLPLFAAPPSNCSGSGLSPAQGPLPSLLLESTSRSVEPSGDGYM
ncbi:uncharacterized protein LOC117730728 isoform X3 [Cyclopterus lumpus]|nr:uncharacterized protein LOC117730728 isoform X3 [Cyclopterus lumpus]